MKFQKELLDSIATCFYFLGTHIWATLKYLKVPLQGSPNTLLLALIVHFFFPLQRFEAILNDFLEAFLHFLVPYNALVTIIFLFLGHSIFRVLRSLAILKAKTIENQS